MGVVKLSNAHVLCFRGPKFQGDSRTPTLGTIGGPAVNLGALEYTDPIHDEATSAASRGRVLATCAYGAFGVVMRSDV